MDSSKWKIGGALLLLLFFLPTFHSSPFSCAIPGQTNSFPSLRALGSELECKFVLLTANFGGETSRPFSPRIIREEGEGKEWKMEGVCFVYVGDEGLVLEEGGGGGREAECGEVEPGFRRLGVRNCGGWLVVTEKKKNLPFPENSGLSLRVLKTLMLSFFPRATRVGWLDVGRGELGKKEVNELFRSHQLALGRSEIRSDLYSTAFRVENNTPLGGQFGCFWLTKSLEADEFALSKQQEELGFFQAIDRVLGREEKQDFLFFDDLELLFASSDEARSADKPWQLPSYTFVQPPTTLQYQQHQGTCFGNQTVYLPQACQDVKVKIMSFPKSGRTWLRCIISAMLHKSLGEDLTSLSLHALDALPKNFSFSHGSPHPYHLTARDMAKTSNLYPENPVIYLARDPRDVSVSNFYEMKTRNIEKFHHKHIRALQEMNFSQFLRFPYGSFTTNVAMMNTWASFDLGKCPRLIVYYENLNSLHCWLSEYEKVAAFLGLWLPRESLHQVKNRCSFDVLNGEIDFLAKGGEDGSLNKRWAAKGENGDPNSKKTRKGKVGGYLEEAFPEDIEFMEKHAHFVDYFKEYESQTNDKKMKTEIF